MILAIILAAGAAVAFAAAGDLDPTFDGDGKVTVDAGVDGDFATGLAIQPDGKIVAVGGGTLAAEPKGYLVRLNTDGSLDGSFDSDGRVLIDDQLDDVVVQPNGLAVAAGSAGDANISMGVYRRNADGSPDANLDGDGQAVIDYGAGFDRAWALTLQADGKIVVVGVLTSVATGRDMAVARLNANGTPDNSFSGDGRTEVSFSAGDEEAIDVAVQPDGKLVVLGRMQSEPQFRLFRMLADGTALDTSFSGDGSVELDFGGPGDTLVGLALQPDGKIVLSGRSSAGPQDAVIIRLNADGTPDASFAGDGRQDIDLGSIEFAGRPTLRPNGSILIPGVTLTGGDAFVAQLTPDGLLDPSFAGDGIHTLDFGADQAVLGLVELQADGKAVAGGATGLPAGAQDMAFARFETSTPPGGDPPLTLELSAKRKQTAEKLSVTATCSKDCGLSARAKGKAGKKFKSKKRLTELRGDDPSKLRIRFKKGVLGKIDDRRGKLTVVATATTATGEEAAATEKIKLKP